MANVGRSCKDCPSYLSPPETVSKFQKSIGAPMCGRFGYILGKPGAKAAQEDKLARHFAQNCDGYGEPLPPLPVKFDHFVVTPDMDARTEASGMDERDRLAKQDICRTCATCKFYVPDDVVSNELGWSAGLCSARGKLLMPTKLRQEARNCEYRLFGPVRRTTMGMQVLPEYEDAFNLNVNPVSAYFKSRDTFIEPFEYPTDKEVTEEEKKTGVRAWRVIKDPEGTGNEVYLPIYDMDFFDVDEREKIPKSGEDEHAELYVDHNGSVYKLAVMWTQLDETPAVWGEAGTGKTELCRHMAWLMCLPFERISITARSDIDDLAGVTKFTPEKGTYFQYGRVPKAWQKPCVLCVDEPNLGPGEVWHFFRPMTDNSKQLVLDMNEGEHIDRHDDCYMAFTMNPPWDPRNIGATPIGDADSRRLMHIFMELPPPALEREIIKNRVKVDGWEIDDARMDTLMSIAEDIRGLCNDGTLPISWGIAQQIKVARALRWFDWVIAYRMAVADFLEKEANAMLLDQVRAHIE